MERRYRLKPLSGTPNDCRFLTASPEHAPSDLAAIRSKLAAAMADLQRRYPIRTLGVFGSVARGEAGAESDVDLLVTFSEPVGLEIVDLAMELEALLGRRVDLTTPNALKQRLRPYVEKDLVYV
jgi:predicted nucleotidyltransferase